MIGISRILLAAGAVSVDGLEWMGARVYDPATMGFLSRDPLPGEPGSVWASNPYEYAANDPLMFSDPLGLKPLTDQELQDHNRNDKWYTRAYNSLTSNDALRNYAIDGALIAGSIVVAALAPAAAPVVALFAAALFETGVDGITQQVTTGEQNYGEMAITFGTAFISGGETLLAKIGYSVLGGSAQYVSTNVLSGNGVSVGGLAANVAVDGVGGELVGQETERVMGRIDPVRIPSHKDFPEHVSKEWKLEHNPAHQFNEFTGDVVKTVATDTCDASAGLVGDKGSRSSIGWDYGMPMAGAVVGTVIR